MRKPQPRKNQNEIAWSGLKIPVSGDSRLVKFLCRTVLSVVLVLLAVSSSLGEEIYFLKGTIGDARITMLLNETDHTCNGSFFFTTSLENIDFTGVKLDGGLSLTVWRKSAGDESDTLATAFLKPVSKGRWQGHYLAKGQAQQLVDLAEVAGSQANPDSFFALERRYYFRFEKGREVADKGVKYAYYIVAPSQITYIQILLGLPDSAIVKINKAMLESACAYAESYFGCTSRSIFTEYSCDISNVLVTEGLVSVALSGSYYCGNASIEDWSDQLNFNAVTGEPLRLEQVLYLAHSNEQKSAGDQTLGDAYVGDLVALLQKLFPRQMAAPIKGQSCDYNATEAWQSASWYFTPEGLFLKPWFRHFYMECGEVQWPLIPYKVLARYTNPASRLKLPGGK